MWYGSACACRNGPQAGWDVAVEVWSSGSLFPIVGCRLWLTVPELFEPQSVCDRTCFWCLGLGLCQAEDGCVTCPAEAVGVESLSSWWISVCLSHCSAVELCPVRFLWGPVGGTAVSWASVLLRAEFCWQAGGGRQPPSDLQTLGTMLSASPTELKCVVFMAVVRL